MALRVWLPLNGTLENKGTSDDIAYSIASGNSFTSNGKICNNALKLTKIQQILGTTSCMTGAKEVSYAFWVKVNTAWSTNWLDGIKWISTDGTSTETERQEFYDNCTYVGTWYKGGSIWGKEFIPGVWTHLAATINYSTGEACFYVNGDLKGTTSNVDTTYYCRGDFYIGDNGVDILQNDVRIYDHCLSPKEVKEISQGLVLHYKLDGWSGGSGENLVWNSNWNKNSTSPPESWTNWGSPPTREIVQINNKYWLHVISNTTQFQGYSQNWTKRAGFGEISAGEILTVSFTAYLASAASIAPIGIHWCNTSSTIVSQVWTTTSLTATPTRYSFTYTTPADCAGFNIMVGDNTNTAHEIWITDIKVERGSVATPWSPAPSDLGIDTTKITDSSGYGNDGTITGTLSTESDSNRYEISTKSLNGTDCIKSPLSLVDVQSFTCSFWVKPSSSNGWYSILASNYNNPSSGFWISTNCEGHALWFYNQAYADTTTANISNDVWHHCAIVCDNKTFSMYIDGVLQTLNRTTSSSKTITINNLSVFNSYTGTSWNTKRYGNISDFRIYATALSAEDILDLYHTPANIDNLQNIHAFELKEQSGNMFAGSPMTGTVTWDATNNYYTITSNPSTSTWGIGPAVGTSPKKIIPWGMSYILTYEVYSPTAAQWYIDYNNNDPTNSLSGNDNDNSRLRTGVNVPANTWTLITYGCSNTNETKNPDHLPLYDYSTGLGPVMTNISSAITWHMRNPQWYLVDADNKEHVYENGVFQVNFLKEDNQSSYTSFRNEEKAAWSHEFIEK